MSQLFPYQKDGEDFLSKKKLALLADEMGLGKTVQAIKALDRVEAKRVLIVCPAIAKVNWLREFEEWADTPRHYEICQRLTTLPSKAGSAICSFEYAAHNYKTLRDNEYDALIVDEAHFLKEPKAKRSKAILGARGICRTAGKVWLLTGTPAPNHPGELWLMLYSFGATNLKYDKFVEHFCLTRKTSYGLKVCGADRQKIPQLQRLLKPIMLRRLKKDVMKELPPISYKHVFVEPGKVDLPMMPSFADYYAPVDRRQELFGKLKKEKKLLEDVVYNMKHPNAKGSLDALAHIWDSVSTLRRFAGLQKVEPAVEIIKSNFKYNAYQYNKLVIFAIHADVIEQLRWRLKEFNPVILYGRTPAEKRQARIDKFQNTEKCKIFIGNIKAAGTAITLTSANNILFVEQDWVPGNNAQAVMRVHRIGQEKPVFARFLAIDNSIDAHVMKIVKAKTRDLTQIFDS